MLLENATIVCSKGFASAVAIAPASRRIGSGVIRTASVGVSHGLATQKGKVGDAKGIDMLDGE